MKFSAEWINEFLPKPLSARQLADALEAAGVEVEEVVAASKIDPKIVVGEIVSVRPHANADKLKIVEVSAGSKHPTIVTGAPNISAKSVGAKVPVAVVGSQLPDGTRLKAAKLRGVESQGMLCSEAELGVSEDHAGIMFLPDTAKPGRSVQEYLISSDVIDATTAANRWDLNGVAWLAREAAAQVGQRPKQSLNTAKAAAKSGFEVKIANPKLVDRYMLAKLEVDITQPTPDWMRQRLLGSGIRSINVVVDITNYCMLELGQPLHAFDASKVKLPVTVRLAQAGESLTTLDGVKRRLNPDDLMIADATGPIGFAGVMGGENSEIDATTTAIYLEAASFNGPSLRKTALRQGLRTDASARFERGLPVELQPVGMERALELLIELAGAKLLGGPVDKLQKKPAATKILARTSRINTVLGLNLSTKRVDSELKKLEFEVKPGKRADELSVGVPWWRPDITHEDDLAEEVIKLVGYEALPSTLPVWRPSSIEFDSHWQQLWRAKAVLVASGLYELVTYSFIAEDQILELGRDPKNHLKLKNPLSSEQAYLRTDLLPSLLKVAERNRAYAKRFGVFEFSKVYLPTGQGKLPKEPLRLGVLYRTERGGYIQVKGILDRLVREFNADIEIKPSAGESGVAHPARTAELMVGKEVIGWVGQLNPLLVQRTKLNGEIGYLEINWSRFVAAARTRTFLQKSRFPSVTRDISVILDRKISWNQVKQALAQYGVEFVNDFYGAELPKDKKALALRLTISFNDRTPTDADADSQVKAVTELLAERFQASLRT